MAEPTPEYDAFISYAAPDKPTAATLHAALTAKGLRVFFDGDALAPGDDWEQGLRETVGASRCLVALMSGAWSEGHYNRQEVSHAVRRHRRGERPRRIIPVELEAGAESLDLETMTTIVAHGAGTRGWIDRLADALGGPPEPAQLPLAPPPLEQQIEDAIVREPSSAPDLRERLLEERRAARGRAVQGEPLSPSVCLGDRFRLVERLGRGGFAEVWRALDRRYDLAPVAVKVLHWNLGHDQTALARFQRGAKHMRGMTHPNIVRVLEPPMEDGGHHYFVMELVEGTALDRYLPESTIPPEAVHTLIRQIGDALSYAHAHGIRHRDVHPGNVIVRADGRVVLIDFDLVEAPGTLGGTRTGTLGTAVFAAPESYMPSPDGQPRRLDAVRMDVYGLAMTAAACWLGRLPHPGDTRRFDRFIDGLPCTEAQKRALHTGLEVEPEDRFGSIDALCTALQLPAPGMHARREPRGKEWRRGRENPLGAMAEALPAEVIGHLKAPWDGDDLFNALRSLAGEPRTRARAALLEWVGPARSTEELAYAWYALEKVGDPPDRAAFFARAGRPLAATDLEWVSVPGGRFDMGARRKSDGPIHPVQVSPFELTATPITAGQFGAFDPGHQPDHREDEPLPESARKPARNVTWWAAYLFARWAGARLPTEAEWEYACLAGRQGEYGCDDIEEMPLYAQFKGQLHGMCPEVGALRPNDFGLYDMHGLVYEWCADWHGPYPESGEAVVDPTGPEDGEERVLRGGAFSSSRKTIRARAREKSYPDSRWPTRGLRLARSRPAAPEAAPSPASSGLNPAGPRDTPPAQRAARSPSRQRRSRVPRKSSGGAPEPRQKVYEKYWYFAAKRQEIFYRRLAGQPGPWTHDEILQTYKFCNAFRASDRVSQFLIRNVIYGDGLSADAEDIVFRTLLFRFFNKNATWGVFTDAVGEPRARTFVPGRYSEALNAEMDRGNVIFGNAYMIAPPGRAFGGGHDKKHDGYLALLDHMMRDGFVSKIQKARQFRDIYQLLLGYPLIGKFIAYQLATDLNYTEVIDFDEDSFTKAGPGAERGIAKCFESRGGLGNEAIIDWMVDNQERELKRLGYDPQAVWLWGRPLKAIDCQNLFCETDKYARVAFPELKSNRKRIKARFSATPRKMTYFYPPKWGINDRLDAPPVELPPLGPAPASDD